MAAPTTIRESSSGPCYTHAEVVTFSDSTNLTTPCRGFYFSHGGGTNHAISVVMDGDGSTVVITAVNPGTLLPIRVRRFNSAGTTAPANSVLALW